MKGKSLIVYYSHSGNTRRIAEMISEKVGGDILMLEPAEPYSERYNKVVEQARKEIPSAYKPELKYDLDDISSYDNIFIGSPNWLNTIAPPVKAFMSKHDFSNKTVIPFCTHGGGSKGRIFKDIEKGCANARVKRGFEIYGSGGSGAEKAISEWLENIL